MTDPSRDDLALATEAAVRLGTMLLAAGSGSFRVQQAVRQAGRALGIERIDLMVGLDRVVATAQRGAASHTLVREVYRLRVDASRLEALEYLADVLPLGTTPDELQQQLDRISREFRGGWRRSAQLVATGLGAAAFALLNHFTVGDALVVLVASALAQWVHLRVAVRGFNPYGAAAVASAVACAAYGALGWALDATGLPVLRDISGPGFVAAVLFLVPGYAIVTALLELARMDFTAGGARLLHAAGMVAAVTGAAWAVTAGWGLRPVAVREAHPSLWQVPLVAVCSLVGMASFALLFNSSRRVIAAAAVLGTACNLLRLGLLDYGVPAHASAAAGGFVVGIGAAWAGPRLQVPRSTLMVPASIIMVPGAAMARTIYWLNVPDAAQAATNGLAAVLTLLAIGAGLASARMLTDPDWAFVRPRPSPGAFRQGGTGSRAV